MTALFWIFFVGVLAVFTSPSWAKKRRVGYYNEVLKTLDQTFDPFYQEAIKELDEMLESDDDIWHELPDDPED